MDISDVAQSANYFTAKYINNFYIIVTYNGNSFILIGERQNFPHLVGIKRQTYLSNGYRKPEKLYSDIVAQYSTAPPLISRRIIPTSISPTSKMYAKVKNFIHNHEIFDENKCPVIIRYDETKSNLKLNNTNIILTDICKGYMLGWVFNNSMQINSSIKMSKYCISTWIDESGSSDSSKQKYMPSQEIELLRHVLIFDKNSELIKKKEYKYSKQQKISVLTACQNNNCNLLLDDANVGNYIRLCKENAISCKINGTQY